jgi:hypothetical protein
MQEITRSIVEVVQRTAKVAAALVFAAGDIVTHRHRAG